MGFISVEFSNFTHCYVTYTEMTNSINIWKKQVS